MLKLGFIGCGKVTERMHLPDFASLPQVSVAALCDINNSTLERLADFYGVKARYKDYKAMLRNEELDAVCVNTPNYLHAKMTVDCCKAGKYVLVEKPVATSRGEVKRMSAAAAEAGVFIMAEQSHRFSPRNEKAHEVIASGFMGKVLGFRARVGSLDPVNWSPTSKWFYKKDEAFGGALADIGIHIVDTIRWVTGKKIARVQAFTAKLGRRGDVEDNGVLSVVTTDGLIGTIEASWTQAPSFFGYQVNCEKGFLEVRSGEGLRAFMGEPASEVCFDVPKQSAHGGPFKYFADCVLNKRRPFVDIEEGGKSLAVVVAAYRSAATGRAVEVKY
ncbi:MAG: Gfo/Idh/MocA family protein [Planctomycetota bacterium]|jgi:predicted dehydrogenase